MVSYQRIRLITYLCCTVCQTPYLIYPCLSSCSGAVGIIVDPGPPPNVMKLAAGFGPFLRMLSGTAGCFSSRIPCGESRSLFCSRLHVTLCVTVRTMPLFCTGPHCEVANDYVARYPREPGRSSAQPQVSQCMRGCFSRAPVVWRWHPSFSNPYQIPGSSPSVVGAVAAGSFILFI